MGDDIGNGLIGYRPSDLSFIPTDQTEQRMDRPWDFPLRRWTRGGGGDSVAGDSAAGNMGTTTMRWMTIGVCLGWALGASAADEGPASYPALGEIVRLDPAIDSLIPKDAKIEVLASGFAWAEGTAWNRSEGFLLFSDIPPNAVMKWSPREGLSQYLKPAGYTGVAPYGNEPGSNGLAFDKKGRLISCEHGDRRVSLMDKDGGKRTLADKYDGKRFNSPNDLAIRANGEIYFTDPPYGLPKQADDPRRELTFCGIYRLGTDGKVTLLSDAMSRPNGIAFSPDERMLYVANSDPERAVWMAFEVKEDGTLGQGNVFHDATALVGKLPGLPDGLKVDAKGNLFATGPGGVHVFSPAGKPLGRLDTKEKTANCGWGDDGSTLYIAADMYLCRVKTSTRGAGW